MVNQHHSLSLHVYIDVLMTIDALIIDAAPKIFFGKLFWWNFSVVETPASANLSTDGFLHPEQKRCAKEKQGEKARQISQWQALELLFVLILVVCPDPGYHI